MTHAKNRPAIRTALVLGLTLASASALPTKDASAFGWSDITGAAKKVGGAVKKGAKVTGKVAVEVAKTPKEAIDKTKEITRRAAGRVVGEASYAAFEKFIRHAIPSELADVKAAKDEMIGVYEKGADIILGAGDRVKDAAIGKAKGIAKDVARKGWDKISTGRYERVGSRPVVGHPGFTRPVGKSGPVTGRAGFSRPVGITQTQRLQKGPKAPVHGIALQNLKPANEQAPKNGRQGRPLGNDRSAWGRPVGGRKPIGNDKSVWGRPVGGSKPLGQDRSKMGRPVGIAKENLKQGGKVKRLIRMNRLNWDKTKFARNLSRKRGSPTGIAGKNLQPRDTSKRVTLAKQTITRDLPRRNRSNGRPKGITKQNLQRRGASKKIMQNTQKFSRDLSRNKGRDRREGRKAQNERKNFKMKMKRSNAKRTMRNRGRGNRRG